MLGLLLLLFIVVPAVELALLIWIGSRIGVWYTIGIILATGLLGGFLARYQGLRAWRDVREAAQAGRMPGVELVAGALFLVGAAFLLTPGVLTDAAGFLLMVPPVRRAVAKTLVPRFVGRVRMVRFQRPPPPPQDVIDVEPER